MAFEVLFGMQRLFELFVTAQKVALPVETHPPSLIRSKVFQHLCSLECEEEEGEGLISGYGAGYFVRLAFDWIIRIYSCYGPSMCKGGFFDVIA